MGSVRQAIKAIGWTEAEAARRAEVSASAVQKLMGGKVMPRVEMALRAALRRASAAVTVDEESLIIHPSVADAWVAAAGSAAVTAVMAAGAPSDELPDRTYAIETDGTLTIRWVAPSGAGLALTVPPAMWSIREA